MRCDVTIKHRVSGEFAQMITCQLDAEQTVYSDANHYRWKTANVSIETRLTTPGNQPAEQKKSGGFLSGALSAATEVAKRALTGQSLAFQWFHATGGSGLIAFCGDEPGQIRVIELDGSVNWLAERHAFICAESGVAFDIAYNGLNQGRRSGEGIFLEKFSGTGTLVLAGGGSIVEVNPSDYGGKIQVHAGAVVAFADSVQYGVEMIGSLNAQTLMTVAFGGQGLSVISFSGDGPVLLQATLHRTMERDEQTQNQEQHRGGSSSLLDRLTQ
jgi:uncharacterized protein (AIM24 family)